MKILMLTPYLPYPPTSGGQVRSYNLIKNLAKKHEITLFSLIKEGKEEENVKELKKYCYDVRVFKRPDKPWTVKNILKTGFSSSPFLVIRNLSEEEKIAVKEELANNKYDLIHAENFYVMPHIPETSTPILLTEQTILYRVFQHYVESLPWYLFWLRPLLGIDVWKLKNLESAYWRKADYLTAVSREDRSIVRSLIPGKRVDIVPNGVDFRYFSQLKYQKSKNPTVLFGASDFHWMQNKEGAKILIEEIWPIIKKKIANCRLWIVGKIAPQALCDYLGSEGVKIQEIQDNREAYQKAWVLVAPMRSGGGSRTKFFEAMASGLPIVTTPEGIEGIPVKNGQEAVIENDLPLLTEKAVELLKNREKAERIGLAGRSLVQKRYDWSKSAEKLNLLYEEIGNEKK